MTEISPSDHAAISALVTEYAWLLDRRRWHEVARLCTDDALLTIRGREIRGQSGLAAWAEYRDLNKSRKTLHQMTNLRLEAVDADRMTGTAMLVLHVAKTGAVGTYVDLVGEYRDEYVRTPTGWRFACRDLVKVEDS